MLSLRIVNVDYYMSPPKSGLDLTYSQFRGTQIKSVPVLRIFGSTASGCKTCLHVHGVFPYILVPYSGDDDPGRIMYQLASSLDKAINVSLGTSHSNKQYVFKIVQVSGRPFYGYHSQDHQFFKIYFYNPLIVKRACDLLQNGAVCGSKFQIHEGHVPFILQFFIDYNLYGMSFIDLKSVIYRKDGGPPGEVAGSLPKDSYCEVEADAVAVDILNRLTVEGELAVNPGLAAIWREEKERLQRECLDSSQRLQPPPTISEQLLREKLHDNLKFQGKCKTPLKDKIPYPAETQRLSGSQVLEASMLDTHSVSSLTSARPTPVEQTADVDEGLILSLTQNSVLSSSLDQSLIMALDSLAAQNEAVFNLSQNVDFDSILGSQLVQEPAFDDDISDGELEALNLSSNAEDSDDQIFESKIPQLDGVNDFRNKKKKSKRRKRKVLNENAATEVEGVSDGEDVLLNLKDNCWPEFGKQEGLDEIFTDDDQYNAPINNLNSCQPVDDEVINIDLTNFGMVLRGDPSFTSGDVASEDVIFNSSSKTETIWNGIDEMVEEGDNINTDPEQSLKNPDGIPASEEPKRPNVDTNQNVNTVPSLPNVAPESSEGDRPFPLASCSEDLLNTSQLDEIFNEDLNKGLEIIYSSPQHEFEEQYKSNAKKVNRLEPGTETEDRVTEEEVDQSESVIDSELCGDNMTYIQTSVEDPKCSMSISQNIIVEDSCLERCIKIDPDRMEDNGCEIEFVNIEDIDINVKMEEEQCSDVNSKSSTKTLKTKRKSSTKSSKGTPNNTPIKELMKSGLPLKIKTASNIKKFQIKKNNIVRNPGLFDMSNEEIEKYYSQLSHIQSYLTNRGHKNVKPPPLLWSPLRNDNQQTQIFSDSLKSNLKKNKISKLKSCKVKLQKLNLREIRLLSRKYNIKINFKNFKKCKYELNGNLTKSSHIMSSVKDEVNVDQVPCDLTDTNNGHVSRISEKKKNKSKKLKANNTTESNIQCIMTPGHPANKTNYKNKGMKSISNIDDSLNSKTILNDSTTYAEQKKHCKVVETLIVNRKKAKSRKGKKNRTESKKGIINSKVVLSEIPSLNISSLELQSNEVKVEVSDTEPEIQEDMLIPLNQSICDEKISPYISDGNVMVNSSFIPLQRFQEHSEFPADLINNNNVDIKLDATSESDCPDISVEKPEKECIIKLLPLSYNNVNNSISNSDIVDESFDTKSFFNFTCDKSAVDSNLAEKIKDYKNVERFVQHDTNEGVSSPTTIRNTLKPRKKRTSSTDLLLGSNPTPCEEGLKHKNKLKIYSLDGTVDNSSSSDENSESRTRIEPHSSTSSCTTPVKQRRKSSKCNRSPKNYVPLRIEITKSPNAKQRLEEVDHMEIKTRRRHGSDKMEVDHEKEDKSKDKNSNASKKTNLKPVVQLKRLPLEIKTIESAESMDEQNFESRLETHVNKPTLADETDLKPIVSLQRLKSYKRKSSEYVKVAIPDRSGDEAVCLLPINKTETIVSRPDLKPVVSVERLRSSEDQPSTSTGDFPVVKRLKVSVRRIPSSVGYELESEAIKRPTKCEAKSVAPSTSK